MFYEFAYQIGGNKTMKKLILIFAGYVIANLAYFTLLNSSIDFGIAYTTWNEHSKTILTVLSITFLYLSLFTVSKLDFEKMKMYIILIAITIAYSGILYYIVDAQIFMLK